MKHVRANDLRGVLEEATAEFQRLEAGAVDLRQKPDGSIVSRVDLGLDAFLHERLARVMPRAAWLSEESASDPDRAARRWAWVVDPLDGSREFARGVPEFAISVGLVERGRVRAGGVVNPRVMVGAACGTDGSWTAWPAFAQTRQTCDLDTATAAVSRTESEDGSITPFVDLVGHVHQVGSVAFKLLRVACGIEDVTFSVQGKSEWDLCGGVALLAARGMTLVSLGERPLLFNQTQTRFDGGFAAGRPDLVDALVERLRARRAELGRRSAGRG